MINHEWKKHGTCSGLNPAAYFDMSARLRNQLAIPAPYQRPATPVRTSYGEFVQAFRAANPRLAENSVLPFCGGGGRFLNEIHVCYDKRGGSISCGAERNPAFRKHLPQADLRAAERALNAAASPLPGHGRLST